MEELPQTTEKRPTGTKPGTGTINTPSPSGPESIDDNAEEEPQAYHDSPTIQLELFNEETD